ncbi:hypothetical protein [Nonomuraea harbinensis]|uniref:RNA polymerase subunit sigma-24 n=1 Tax=Nonomuraea harbinensis TaxID=1286938 RepID=A0ABW1C3J9_9ACTN|nr:hypothetical protein [Nonomuraea harbinensis]
MSKLPRQRQNAQPEHQHAEREMDRRYVRDAEHDLDGGEGEEAGVVGTVLRPVEGGARIAQYMVAIADKAPGLELLERSVNGVPGLVARRAGEVVIVTSFDVADGRVARIWAVRNPRKLRPWMSP